MSKSNLATRTYLASPSNYAQGRKGYKICKFTPHHMTAIWSAQRCGEEFQNPTRKASSNYGIGISGEIACYVEEENRAYTSSSASNDCQAITVEVANCERGGQWRISDASWNSLVNLAVDVCRRYNFRLSYDGTPNGSLTNHDMFKNTNCPGPYLKGRMKELERTVNAILDGGSASHVVVTPATPRKDIATVAAEVIAGKWGNGDTRRTNLTAAGYNYSEVQAKVNELLNTKKPTTINSAVVTPAKKSNETIADEIIAGKWGNGQDRVNAITNAGYDYNTIQQIVNVKLGGKSTPTISNKKSNEEIANEVIKGLWGNGVDRKNKLVAAGYNYNTIQKLVNKKLKK